MCAEKCPLVSMGGRGEGLACADPGARTPISASENFLILFLQMIHWHIIGPGLYSHAYHLEGTFYICSKTPMFHFI